MQSYRLACSNTARYAVIRSYWSQGTRRLRTAIRTYCLRTTILLLLLLLLSCDIYYLHVVPTYCRRTTYMAILPSFDRAIFTPPFGRTSACNQTYSSTRTVDTLLPCHLQSTLDHTPATTTPPHRTSVQHHTARSVTPHDPAPQNPQRRPPSPPRLPAPRPPLPAATPASS